MKFCKEHSHSIVSWGTFIALKPFYIRHTTIKDMEMCCCKLHLHSRWSINALVECANKNHLEIPFIDYQSFFQHLSASCSKDQYAYINWNCTPNEKLVCDDIQSKWGEIQEIFQHAHEKTTVSFTEFQKVPHVNKRGDTQYRLKAVKREVNHCYLISFINSLLPKIVHHRNMLKHYRLTHNQFLDQFNCVNIDIDFSENLSIPTKYEPQSMHWYKEQVSVHSGILKVLGEKSYHPCFSDNKVHDQAFVKVVLEKMLDNAELQPDSCIVIESDNCCSQYKSSQHFFDIQKISDKYNRTVLRIFSIAGHGKGEVDHVGGITKVIIRREIAAGEFFASSADMVEFLNEKFKNHSSPVYYFKELDSKELETERVEAKMRSYSTIEGSSKFHVMVFKPNSNVISAAQRLCICSTCEREYGTCSISSYCN